MPLMIGFHAVEKGYNSKQKGLVFLLGDLY